MSVAAPKNTLLYQRKGRPLTLKRDISSAPITDVAAKARQFANEGGANINPETEAIMFYLANHAMKELEFRFDQEEPLPDWALHICNGYHRNAARIAARAFYYLLLITAREARHNHIKTDSSWQSKLKSKFGDKPMMGLLHYPDQNSIDAVTQVFDSYVAGANLGDVCRSIVYTFYEGKFSSSYGGPKWGNVADCMTNYVTGEYTAEMMLDTVWTLVHNGGPIFNKGMLYECYNASALQMVLDIQRAGQIPRLVLSPTGNGQVSAEKYVKEGAKKFAQFVSEKLGGAGDFAPGVCVDFKQVQALGAVGHYSSLMNITTLVSPLAGTPWAQPVPAGDPVTEKTHYVIAKAPGLVFKKISRKEVHAD